MELFNGGSVPKTPAIIISNGSGTMTTYRIWTKDAVVHSIVSDPHEFIAFSDAEEIIASMEAEIAELKQQLQLARDAAATTVVHITD